MQPGIYSVHTDAILTNFSKKIAPNIEDCQWRNIAPIIRVSKKSDNYYTFDQGDRFRITATKIADGDHFPISGFNLSSDSYDCEQFSQGTNLTWAQADNADDVLQLRLEKSQFCTEQTELKMEYDLAAAIDTTNVWGTDVVGTTDFVKWSTYDTSTPVDDFHTGIDTFVGECGKFPNVLVLPYQTWSVLSRHPELLDILGAQERGIIKPELLAQVLNLEKVIICKSIYNSAEENQDASYNYIWGKNALLLYIAPNPGRATATAVHTFEWKPFVVRQVAGEKEKTDYIERYGWYDYKVVASNLGYYFSAAVA